MDKKGLLELKEQIDEAKKTAGELTGKLNYLNSQLKETWDCKNVTEADTKVNVMYKKIEKLEKQIKTGIEELEEAYDFD